MWGECLGEDLRAVKLQRETLGYFLSNRERMRYHWYRARGLHRGSGVAESSCKNVAQARLKQAGMRWTEAGPGPILQFR